ncbi:ABC transporter G family member 20-like [Lycorma delicatula]|uniref:ABC transporter G family member 20-like n=1 Tax=Lycorma delicatula TaxID=130591 RepID=UPI003F517642
MESLHSDNTSILLQGVCKEYNHKHVLENLNMDVPKGCIYGLLGPSGCGKTTLLNCIMGTTMINNGKIKINIKKPSDVGLMPQEVALTTVFTIKETFQFHGKLLGMTNNEIEKTGDELIELLQLPQFNTRIGSMSGGQQRRVSFAVAFLHDPNILLLDEPTVGLDPLLSHSIWEYLIQQVARSHKTIIITTHYIEEARQANKVGLMRKGTILIEGSPAEIMQIYNSDNLEDAFLLLCNQEEKKNKIKRILPPTSTATVQSPLSKNRSFSFNRLIAQTYKNFLFMTKEIQLLLFILIIPVISCFVRNIAWGGDPTGLILSIVNHDTLNCSTEPLRGCNYEQSMSCRYLQHLYNSSNFIQADKKNLEEAKKSVLNNNAWGLIYFGPNFSSSLIDRIFSEITDIKNESLETGSIQVQMDSTNKIISDLIKYKLSEEFNNFLKNLYLDCGWQDALARAPIKIEEYIYGSKHPTFTKSQTASYLMGIFFYIPVVVTLGQIMPEKENGVMQRSRAAGMKTMEFIIPVAILQTILSIIQISTAFLIEFIIFKNPLVSSIWLPGSMLLLQAFNGLCFGLFITSISDSVSFTMTLSTAVVFFITSINGTLWPMEGVHPFISKVIWWTPLALPSEALQGITARGWNIFHPKIYLGYAALVGWAAVYLSLTYLFNYNKRLKA